MKRFILFLLVGAMLLLPLSGCFAGNQQNKGTTPNVTTENTTPEVTIPEATTPESTTPEVTIPEATAPESTTPEETTLEATTPPENNQNNPPIVEVELDKDTELIANLIAYLDQIWVQRSIIIFPLSTKIDGIKNGAQPLHVAFDPTNYYFVCGYYNPTEEDSEWNYCCAEEYTWVQYANEDDIPEYYNGRKFLVAFQMNRALTVTDLLNSETANNMEHFQIYSPVFENGFNTESPIVFDETFIYLNNFRKLFDEDMIYHSTSWYYHRNQAITCVSLDGEYYLPLYLATIKFDEEFNVEQALSEDHFKYELGNYYDPLVNIMDTEKYRVEHSTGSFHYYGVVSLDDFVNKIIK